MKRSVAVVHAQISRAHCNPCKRRRDNFNYLVDRFQFVNERTRISRKDCLSVYRGGLGIKRLAPPRGPRQFNFAYQLGIVISEEEAAISRACSRPRSIPKSRHRPCQIPPEGRDELDVGPSGESASAPRPRRSPTNRVWTRRRTTRRPLPEQSNARSVPIHSKGTCRPEDGVSRSCRRQKFRGNPYGTFLKGPLTISLQSARPPTQLINEDSAAGALQSRSRLVLGIGGKADPRRLCNDPRECQDQGCRCESLADQA
jgi:hypothetical protein